MAARVILACILLIVTRVKTGAEGFLDLYGGPAIKGTADVRVSGTGSSGTTSAASSIDLSSSAAFGARMGVWHPTYTWIGLGMDIGYLNGHGPGVDIDAIPFSFLLALRAPLYATPDRPGGRLQPYAMAGLSFYLIDISVHPGGAGGSSLQGSSLFFGGSGDPVLGPYLAAGLAWQPSRNLAVFGEYRYSSFDAGFDTTNSFLFPTANGKVDTSVKTGHVLFGFSYRFMESIPGKEALP
jgi:opacity protein-like surface antigen